MSNWKRKNRKGKRPGDQPIKKMDFADAFQASCDERKILRPPPEVMEHVKDGRVDAVIDRLTQPQWEALCAAFKVDRSLLGLRLVYQGPSDEAARNTTGQRATQRLYGASEGGAKSSMGVVQEPAMTKLLASSLSVLLASNKSILSLALEGIRFTPEGIKIFSKGLKSNRSLLFFSMTNCRIGDGPFDTLCHSLMDTHIEALCLRGCQLGDDAGKRIAQLIRHHAARRQNIVWMASLRGGVAEKEMVEEDRERWKAQLVHGDADAEATKVAALLQTHTEGNGLRHIDISNNHFRDATASDLSSALSQDEWIAEVNMACNQISNLGATSLLDHLAVTVSLIYLDVTGNPDITTDVLERVLHQLLAVRRRMEREQNGLIPIPIFGQNTAPPPLTMMLEASQAATTAQQAALAGATQRGGVLPTQQKEKAAPLAASQLTMSHLEGGSAAQRDDLDAIVEELLAARQLRSALQECEEDRSACQKRTKQAEAAQHELEESLTAAHKEIKSLRSQLSDAMDRLNDKEMLEVTLREENRQAKEKAELMEGTAQSTRDWSAPKPAKTKKKVIKKKIIKKMVASPHKKDMVKEDKLLSDLEASFLNLSTVVDDLEKRQKEPLVTLDESEHEDMQALVDRMKQKWA